MIKTKVLKRDGRLVEFDKNRISRAVGGAVAEVGDPNFELASQIADSVVATIERGNYGTVSVEKIQDLVEEALMSSDSKDVARAYILYRDKRNKARSSKSDEVIAGIINAEHNDITRENANSDASTPAGMMAKIASERSKEYAMNYLLSKGAKEWVQANLLYPHDQDYMATRSLTCATARTNVTIKTQDGKIQTVKMSYFDKFFTNEPTTEPEWKTPNRFIWIMGRNGWTKITGVSRRLLTEEDALFNIRTRKGTGIELTGTHLVPVIDAVTKTEKLKDVASIKVGDLMLKPSKFEEESIDNDYIDVVDVIRRDTSGLAGQVVVYNIRQLREWLRYRYNIQSLPKYLGSDTYRYGTSYITLSDYKMLSERFEIPYDVIQSMEVHMLNGNDCLPMYLPVSKELAMICGYLHSDGSVYCNMEHGNYHIAFTGYNKDINDNFKDVFSKVFSNHLILRKQDGKYAGWLFSSKLLTLLFANCLGKHHGSLDLSVPQFVLNGSDEIKWAYLSAVIDGDGCLSGKGGRQIRISTSCKDFANELMGLLQSLGVESAIQTRAAKGAKAKFPNGYTACRNSDFYSIVVTGYDNIKCVFDNLMGIKQQSIDVFYAAKPSNAVKYESAEVTHKLPMNPIGEVVYDLETVEHWWVANDYVLHNCIQHPMDKLLSEGFVTGHGESRPAKRIETGSILCAISLESVQNLMHGGQAIPAFDYYLAPYVRMTFIEELKKVEAVSQENLSDVYNLKVDDYLIKEVDDLKGRERLIQIAMNETVKRVHQSMEAFVHNMNTIHSRAGNQVVFSSVNYGTDTSAEGRCIIRELLLATEEGVGNGSTAIFP